jgi:hypothetical protein
LICKQKSPENKKLNYGGYPRDFRPENHFSKFQEPRLYKSVQGGDNVRREIRFICDLLFLKNILNRFSFLEKILIEIDEKLDLVRALDEQIQELEDEVAVRTENIEVLDVEIVRMAVKSSEISLILILSFLDSYKNTSEEGREASGKAIIDEHQSSKDRCG